MILSSTVDPSMFFIKVLLLNILYKNSAESRISMNNKLYDKYSFTNFFVKMDLMIYSLTIKFCHLAIFPLDKAFSEYLRFLKNLLYKYFFINGENY